MTPQRRADLLAKCRAYADSAHDRRTAYIWLRHWMKVYCYFKHLDTCPVNDFDVDYDVTLDIPGA